MKVQMEPGTYVVAVSGGVDSMVLLDVLARAPGLQLTVAHFDHGIRTDSVEDRKLVEAQANELGLSFVYAEGHLGKDASEDTARRARYEFLESVRIDVGARAIITAHHQDDVIETALLNLLRGTNRRGLSSLRSGGKRLRPLLPYAKADIRRYAEERALQWYEDSTNSDETYRRNLVRHRIVGRMSSEQRQSFLGLLRHLEKVNDELDALLDAQLTLLETEKGLRRRAFTALDHGTAREVMALWLRRAGVADYDAYTLERLVISAKTGQPGTVYDIRRGVRLGITKDYLALDNLQR